MPSANVLLQLYKGGWREQTAPVITDNLRIEAALGSGAVETEEEAERIAVGQLDLYAEPLTSRVVSVQPVGPLDTPWLSHRPGSTLLADGDEQVVESLSYTRGENGDLTFAAELGSHIDTPEERLALSDNKMAHGTIGGTSRPAQPLDLTPEASLFRPARPTCCHYGWTGTGVISGVDPGDSGVVDLFASDLGDLFVPPADDIVPEGIWLIECSIRLTFGADATGPATVYQIAPGTVAGANPAAAGGILTGRGYANGDPELNFDAGGAYLLASSWSPSVEVQNDTDEEALITVRARMIGTACNCTLAASQGGA